MAGLFDFLDTVYGQVGLKFKLRLSTRPEKYLGAIEAWDSAEAMLTTSLDDFAAKENATWSLNPGDGAFYGPKIDVKVLDALNREFQCATIQLDFQLPQRFELDYMTAEKKPAESKDEGPAEAAKPEAPVPQKAAANKEPKPLAPGYARPVMIHRAVYGSFERFIAILTEHFAGKWPFWLSPRQILIIPVMTGAHDYVLEVQKIFRAQGMHADVDISGNTMPKKLRTGALAQYNFLFVVGAQEIETRTVNVWNRDDPATHAKGALVPLDTAVEKLIQLRESRAIVTTI
jgi:threonyl-tRNA synthetase